MKPEESRAKEIFSKYVRLGDCVKTTKTTDFGKCYTCGKVVSFEQSQCGHFVSGRGNSLFFEENNSRLQCSCCNINLGGNHDKFRDHLVREVGEEEVCKLELLRHIPQKITKDKFKYKFKHYKTLIGDIFLEN